jgi:hypothetical protein
VGINSRTAVGGGIKTRASGLKARREKSILGSRTKTTEKNHYHWPKNKAREKLRTGASMQGKTRPKTRSADREKELQQRKTYDRNELNQLRIYELWRRKNQQTVTLCAARTETKPQSLERDHDGLTSSGELTGRTPEKIGEHRTQVAPAPKA